ncbi:MAG: helix-turn-helix domain-containing protein, partial [Deltaproteobacteria bacterium]|nr:helix-turn-helix domain-containing protein [Deltaproteobacteria bacterium]
MNRKYTQLTIEDRAIIGALLKEGWSIRRIGRELLRA